MKKWLEEQKTLIIILVITVITVISISAMKYRGGEINYQNSDATWHTLLTMEAYDETPIRIHKFLPIVSLGSADDKFISWGGTIPDEYGNYYYTSFSPAGYVLPYLFVKLLGLPISEVSLYYFNTALFVISAVLWVILLDRVYLDNSNKGILLLIGALTYIFSPELFHGMGIVYWHQSLMQVTLLIQVLSYFLWKKDDSKHGKRIFWVMTLVNPYIEWTGYIANVGFAIMELFINRKDKLFKSWRNPVKIAVLSVSSFIIFSLHYLSVVSTMDFLRALKNRFLDRSFSSTTRLADVFGGYINSFLFLWLLLAILIIWNVAKSGKLEFKNRCLLFITTFLILENIIMKQHAYSYTYDRMKMIFLLSLIICEFTNQILESVQQRKRTVSVILCIITVSCCIGNARSYLKSDQYIWSIDYRQNNEKLATYINENYPNSILVTQAGVRGYLNLLFGRGIYEMKTIDSAITIAGDKGKDYAVEIVIGDDTTWNMYQLAGAIVYEKSTGEYKYLELGDNGTILEEMY